MTCFQDSMSSHWDVYNAVLTKLHVKPFIIYKTHQGIYIRTWQALLQVKSGHSYIFTKYAMQWSSFHIFHCSALTLQSFVPLRLPQSCDAAIRVRYLPVISLGSGVVPGHGTWPSTSQMHSLRQYFFGPKLAGLEACFLASASPFNTSLKTEQRGIWRSSLPLWKACDLKLGHQCNENAFIHPIWD